MWRWLMRKCSSAGADTGFLGSPKSIRALIAELRDAPADRAIRTLSERFDAIRRQDDLTVPRRSRALRQQYSLLQFQIAEADAPLNAGAPVMVIAVVGERVTGIVLPRAALAQSPSGQTVVFSHREPELFVPRPVRAEPFDGDSVLVTAGIAAGERIVVRNALLLNQVR